MSQKPSYFKEIKSKKMPFGRFFECDQNEKDGEGNTPMLHFLKNKATLFHLLDDRDIMKAIEFAGFKQKNNLGETVLHVIASKNDTSELYLYPHQIMKIAQNSDLACKGPFNDLAVGLIIQNNFSQRLRLDGKDILELIRTSPKNEEDDYGSSIQNYILQFHKIQGFNLNKEQIEEVVSMIDVDKELQNKKNNYSFYSFLFSSYEQFNFTPEYANKIFEIEKNFDKYRKNCNNFGSEGFWYEHVSDLLDNIYLKITNAQENHSKPKFL